MSVPAIPVGAKFNWTSSDTCTVEWDQVTTNTHTRKLVIKGPDGRTYEVTLTDETTSTTHMTYHNIRNKSGQIELTGLLAASGVASQARSASARQEVANVSGYRFRGTIAPERSVDSYSFAFDGIDGIDNGVHTLAFRIDGAITSGAIRFIGEQEGSILTTTSGDFQYFVRGRSNRPFATVAGKPIPLGDVTLISRPDSVKNFMLTLDLAKGFGHFDFDVIEEMYARSIFITTTNNQSGNMEAIRPVLFRTHKSGSLQLLRNDFWAELRD
ncbi:MAG TPA: hypothetical protein VFB38_15485 [Chthonomonadaceae bacterium]|nr:hypothetical protein [Chthonomonadaceae bacterium]